MVLSVGSINADFLMRVPHAPCGPGATDGHDLLRTSGGKGANVAVLAARLGAPATLIGCIGEDDLADQALDALRRAGDVDLSEVRTRPGPTGYASILVPPDGAKAIARLPGANGAWADDADEVHGAVLAAPEGSVVVTDAEIPEEVAAAALRAGRRRGFATILDPAPPSSVSATLLDLADHVVPDHRELEALTERDADGPEASARAADALRRAGPGTVHAKLADGGCITVSGSATTRVDPPDHIDVVDATGAGDAFAGALAWALLQGQAVDAAARTAVAAAACAVGAYGSQESYPSPAELEAMLVRTPAARSA